MWIKIIFIIAIANAHSEFKLDFSYSGLTKEKFFRGVNSSVSSWVEKAKELNLRGNYFDSFIDCSARLHNLEVLDISENELQRFYFACKNQDVLYKLNVSHNRLPYLNDTALTERVSKLQILDISFNELQHISDKSFQHLTSLHFLKMNANPISNNIDDNAFKNLISLVDLDMSNISTNILSHGLLTPLVSLKYLSLAFNPIEVLPDLPTRLEILDISGTNIIHIKRIGTGNLIRLRMNYMPRFESLDLNDLWKLDNLTDLSIENCPILKNITSYPIHDEILPSLYRFSLKNCSINKLSIDLEPIIKRISKLNLQENPWNCDCSIKWIISMNSTRDYNEKLRCKSPEKLRDKRFSEISNDDELDCESSKSILLTLFICLGFSIASVIATALFCITKGSLRDWHRKLGGPGNTVTYANIITRSNETEKILEECDITDYP